MIVRSWHGAVPIEQGEAFGEYLNETGVAEAKATPGNLGVSICRRAQNGYEHFFMVSYWTDFEVIKVFAGPEPDIAVTYPEDADFGLISDPIVLHHEVDRMQKLPFYQE